MGGGGGGRRGEEEKKRIVYVMLSLGFARFLILPSRFLLGLARADALANLLDPRHEGDKKRKGNGRRGKSLVHGGSWGGGSLT